jgi:hypothetical protein
MKSQRRSKDQRRFQKLHGIEDEKFVKDLTFERFLKSVK